MGCRLAPPLPPRLYGNRAAWTHPNGTGRKPARAPTGGKRGHADRPPVEPASPIRLPPMRDPHHQHHQHVIPQVVDHPPVTDPKAITAALQRLHARAA